MSAVAFGFFLILWILKCVDEWISKRASEREYRRHNYNYARQSQISNHIFGTMSDMDGNALYCSKRYPKGVAYELSGGVRTGVSADDIETLVKIQCAVEGFEYMP